MSVAYVTVGSAFRILGDTAEAVEPVLVDAGDDGPLLLERRLVLDDRGQREDLVEGHPARLRHVHPLLADLREELVQQHADERLRRR